MSFGMVVQLIVIIFLNRRYRKLMSEKDRSIIQRLQENDCLAKELAKVKIEKYVIDKTLERFINQLTIQSKIDNISKDKIE